MTSQYLHIYLRSIRKPQGTIYNETYRHKLSVKGLEAQMSQKKKETTQKRNTFQLLVSKRDGRVTPETRVAVFGRHGRINTFAGGRLDYLINFIPTSEVNPRSSLRVPPGDPVSGMRSAASASLHQSAGSRLRPPRPPAARRPPDS